MVPTTSSSSRGRPHQQQKQSPWGARAAALALGISLLATLPWEKLDHSFPYENAEEVPDTGAQDKPRLVAGLRVTHPAAAPCGAQDRVLASRHDLISSAARAMDVQCPCCHAAVKHPQQCCMHARMPCSCRFTRSVIHIDSHGDLLEGWLYLPKDR